VAQAPSSVSFDPVRPTRASNDVVAQIREAILSGRVKPGDRLPTERDMAQQFGVSRVTIRDALRALEAGGLIRVKVGGGGGPYVTQPDIGVLRDSLSAHFQLHGATLRELAEARMALETTAARLAAERATDADLTSLKSAIERRASLDFHATLVGAAHNRPLLTMFSATRALIQEAFDGLHARQPDMVETARRVHTQLYEAIASREPDLAVRLMREHMLDFAARAERAERAETG
jgi:GntR family transcriptional regulator, transcriptional repressor for pyruvate dehydrogenase complex